MSALANSNDRSAYQPFANGNRSSGYDPAAAINGQIAGRGMYETSNPPAAGFEDKWAKWFGQPPYGYFEPDNYAQLGHENFQLPTAYVGRNLHIEKMLNVAIASEDDFYTRVLLPWKVYDGMKITYSRWSGFDHMMYQVPEEVPAPQIMTKFESGEAYQQRYGLAFKMEHGFQRTEMGQQAYAANLAIISQAVLRTVYARIMQVLVSQRNMLAVFAQRQHHNALIQAREVSKLAVHSFGTLQKNTYGMDHVIGQVEALFHAKMLAQPDAVILPQGCIQYLKTCKPEERVFALCGELSRRLQIDPQKSISLNVYKNNYQIFEHRPLTVSDDPSNINMLVRDREVGNVFRLFRNMDSIHDRPSATAIKVIDHDKQRWATITLGDALKQCGVFDENLHVEGHPLLRRYVIQDLNDEQLRESTIIEAVESVKAAVERIVGKDTTKRGIALDQIFRAGERAIDYTFANAQSNIGSSVATASVEDVANALQGGLLDSVVTDEPTDEMSQKMNSNTISSALQEIVTVTNDMSEVQRGSIASAIVGSVSGFKSSKSALRKVLRNKDAGKQEEYDMAFTDALKKDFRTNWKNINTEAKKIASNIGARTDDNPRMTNQMRSAENHVEGDFELTILKRYFNYPLTIKAITALDEQGIVTPFGAYIFRPFQNFSMGSAIVMRSGNDTGFTAVGNSDFTLGDNATNKTHLGHFTFYFEPVVTENNHVMIARDIAFMGYNGGCGVEFMDWASAFRGERRVDGHSPSLLVALAYHHETKEQYRMDPMSMTGKFHDSSILKSLDPKNTRHYETAEFYENLIGSQIPIDATTADASDDGYYNHEYSNFICYQGLQAERGPDFTFSQHTTNTGHLGKSQIVTNFAFYCFS
jgi:hypothetical protein